MFYLVSVSSCQKEQAEVADANTFINPLLPSGADPWVIQKDSFYYFTSTTSSSIILYKTKNISRLSQAEHKEIWKPPVSGPNSTYIWAPELHFLNKKWYLYYAAGSSTDLGTHRLFVLENSSPNPLEGTWIDKGRIADPESDFFAIDATVLELNGKQFMLWSSLETANGKRQCLYIAQLANPWTFATHRTLISSPQYGWEKYGSLSTEGVNEGPEILKNKAGKIFLVYSASGCWTDSYGLGMMTLSDTANPLLASSWKKTYSPVFSTKAESGAFGPGHNSFFKSPNGTEDWFIYHANPQANQQCSGFRNPRIQSFTWNEDGTPNFGTPLPINKKITRPSGESD